MPRPPTPPPHFEREPSIRDVIEFRRRDIFDTLVELLPDAELEHVGSTAIPNGWTSGVVDVQVRLPPARVADAEKVLAGPLQRGEDGAFAHEGRGVRVLVTPIGSKLDVYHKHRDLLKNDPLLRDRYDGIKRRMQGGDFEAYRVRKATFWREWDAFARAA